MKSDLAIPKRWMVLSLGDIIQELVGGGTPSRAVPQYFGGEITWLTPTEIPRARITTIASSKENITELGLRKSSARLVPPGSVLLTSRATIGNIAIAGKELATNQGFASIVCPPGLFNLYLAYWLLSIRQILNDKATGTTFKEISKSKLRTFDFPLPPLPEQRRIVAKIEELFSDLEAGVEALRKVKAELKRYRQAVLKAAVEGKLTEEWREKNKDKLEPASVLLERIRAGRAKNGKAKKLQSLDTSELPRLPEGWEWTSMGVVCEKVQDGTHFSPKAQYSEPGPGRYLYITAKNIRPKGLDLSDVTYIDEQFHRNIFKRCNPEKGDVLLTKDGVNTGDTAVNTLDGEFSVLSSIALLKPKKNLVIGRYIKIFVDSPIGQKLITGQMTGTAIKRIVLERVRTSPFIICGIDEQRQIVSEVDHRLSAADEVEKTVEAGLKQAERLRQSILKKAFEGKLVPQDPSDPPASDLLERIKQEKETRQNVTDERKVRKKTSADR